MIYDGSIRDTTNFCSDEYLTINSCNIQKSEGRSYTVIREHGRVDYHILYIAEGSCACLYEGTEAILTKGMFVVYPPGKKQRYSYAKGIPGTSFWIHFSGAGAKRLLETLGICGGIFRSPFEKDIKSCFEKMIYHHSLNTKRSLVAAQGELIGLFSLLAKENGEQHDAAYSEAVAMILKFIHSNWQKQISVADVAQRICLSESRTAHLFKEAIGKAIHQYITDLRISTAKELLTSTSLGISEISEMVGFQDALYFSRAFKAQTSLSPKAFRAAQSKHEPTD
ncbi:MAG: helix-turn-helix domain-containing protein [Clostridia bacterium]|nr:helix-turn-helix domain-containing protein [Clostridia bacterium]